VDFYALNAVFSGTNAIGKVSMLRISVLLSEEDEARFSAYCRERGFKKSTLIARLIREHMDREGYGSQVQLTLPTRKPPGGSQDDGSRS